MQIDRQELLNVLTKVQPATAKNKSIEQSDYFIFQNKMIQTYNDEISIYHPIDLDINGAIEASTFKDIISKLKTKEVNIETNEKELIISKGKKMKIGLPLKKEITSPFYDVESIENWKDLPTNFLDGIKFGSFCIADQNAGMAVLQCMYIDNDTIKASDGARLITYKLTSEMTSFLITGTAAKQLVKYPIEKYHITDEWLFFKTNEGVVFGCRVFFEAYPDIASILDMTGSNLTFPNSIIPILNKAEITAEDDENKKGKVVLVEFNEKQITVKSKSSKGWFKEFIDTEMDQGSFSFSINANYLKEILGNLTNCIIDDDASKIKFVGENWNHIVMLIKE